MIATGVCDGAHIQIFGAGNITTQIRGVAPQSAGTKHNKKASQYWEALRICVCCVRNRPGDEAWPACEEVKGVRLETVLSLIRRSELEGGLDHAAEAVEGVGSTLIAICRGSVVGNVGSVEEGGGN